MGMCLPVNRLVLRPLEPKDCAEMVRILADPVISHWVPVLPFPYTASDAKGFFKKQGFPCCCRFKGIRFPGGRWTCQINEVCVFYSMARTFHAVRLGV